MSDEKVYTKTEHEILVSVARVETLCAVADDNFNEHVKNNKEDFDRLYSEDEKILSEVKLIPEKMTKCSEKIKTETLQIARGEFATNVEMAETKGSLKTTYIVMGILQSILLIFLAAWIKQNGV